MAWTAPSTFVAGAILTAAQLNTNVRDNTLAGGPIYATEALRDAAITSPFEGQRAYITGSTVASATGANAAIPTGIQTIYNGSNWVCVTPMGGWSGTTGTTNSVWTTTVTTLSGDATAISATLSTGTTVRLAMSANFLLPAAGVNVFVTYSVSGATTVSAGSTSSMVTTTAGSNYYHQIARELIITGLTAGTNTFTLNYAVASNTVTFINRSLVAQGIA